MNIIININKAFIRQACTLLCSILINNEGNISFYVMHSDLEKDEFDLMNKVALEFGKDRCQILDLKINQEMMSGCYVKEGRWPLAVYYRLFAPYFLHELDRILYLDADMIVDGSLEALYNMELEDNMIACVPDDVIMQKGEFYQRLGLSRNHIYINSGMILFNVKKISEKYTIEDMLNIIQMTQNNLKYPDQDALNKMYSNQIMVVDYGYNWLCIPGRKNETNHKIIYHFGGEKEYKPWNSIYIGKYSSVFWKYAQYVYADGAKANWMTKLYGNVYHQYKVIRRFVKWNILQGLNKN